MLDDPRQPIPAPPAKRLAVPDPNARHRAHVERTWRMARVAVPIVVLLLALLPVILWPHDRIVVAACLFLTPAAMAVALVRLSAWHRFGGRVEEERGKMLDDGSWGSHREELP